MSSRLFHNMALNLEECVAALELDGQPTYPGNANGTLWCNATWDTFLCWPAIPANSSYTLPCPPLRGLIPEKHVIKYCHASARWAGKDETDFGNSYGYTDYIPCMRIDYHIFEKAQQIAAAARNLEFVGLTLSLMSLTAAIVIFSMFRRLRVFRNQIHQQLMLAILLTVIIRLILYVDLSLSKDLGPWVEGSEIGYTINSTKVLCEAFYIFLEYVKTVAFAFMFMEGFCLHNTVVVNVFQETEPNFVKYLTIGWGFPAIHVSIWIAAMMLIRNQFSLDRCLGEYYMQTEFWIMDGVRSLEFVTNFVFLLNIVRVLRLKVRETHSVTELEHISKSVKAALMLLPLLGIPNIMQTIPFTPTRNNIIFFAVYTYCASFFYVFQGLMVSVLYCFTNREVIDVIKSRYGRYKLRHQSADRLRSGSSPKSRPAKVVAKAKDFNNYSIYSNLKYAPTDGPCETTGFSVPLNHHNGAATDYNKDFEHFQKHELSPLVSTDDKSKDYDTKFP